MCTSGGAQVNVQSLASRVCAQKARPLCKYRILWVCSHANIQGRTIHRFLCPAQRQTSRRTYSRPYRTFGNETDVSKYLLFAKIVTDTSRVRYERKLRQVNSEDLLTFRHMTFEVFFCNPSFLLITYTMQSYLYI